MLAIYEHRKVTVVDVLNVHQAFIDDRGKLVLTVEAPKLVKDRLIGHYLDWTKLFDLPVAKLRYHEPLDSEFTDGKFEAVIAIYKCAVDQGLKNRSHA